MITEILLSILLCLVTTALYFRFCYWGRLLAKIPGNTDWPLIGNFVEITKFNPESAFKYLRECVKKHGRIYKMRILNVRAVNIHHPEDIEKIYSTTTHNRKEIPYNFLRPWLCEGLLISNGEKWRQRRKLLTPAFHFNILRKFCRTFNEQTEQFLKCVEAEIDKDRTDIMPLVASATLNIMCETTMGTSVQDGLESVSKKYFHALHSLGDLMLKRYFTVWFHIDWIYKCSLDAFKERTLLKDLHNFTINIIMKRKHYLQNNKITNIDPDKNIYFSKVRLAMLDLLLINERDGKIDLKGVREEVDTFLFEGHDTTARALHFMIMRIANEPEIQEKIYKELVDIFGDSRREPTTNDLIDMKYLECCIKESLRLYPSVPFIARYITEEVELGGYIVPPGTILHIHVFDAHRNPEIYPDPEKFNPDRFLPEKIAARHPYAYIPFSAGPRNCIGQKFAMLEMKTLMSGLLRRFRLEPVTKVEDIVFVGDMVLTTREPLYVRFKPRVKTE